MDVLNACCDFLKVSSCYSIMGLCLLQNEICPISLNRHVLKYILGRRIGWHDLAFFDPITYESLRQLALDAESKVQLNSFFFVSFQSWLPPFLTPKHGRGKASRKIAFN